MPQTPFPENINFEMLFIYAAQLELRAAVAEKKLHPAMIDLCHALGREIPWIRRW